jgi:F-type H+-transporting ATPase subunit b
MDMKRIVLLALVIVPAILLANEGHSEESRYLLQTGRETDYWPRVINFTIFASIIYYLMANPIKEYFSGRSEGIANQLKEIEAKLQAAKDEQKIAQERLEESTKKASDIVDDAKKEAEILVSKIATACDSELEVMEKQLQEQISLEERKAVREAIDEILNENISASDIAVSESKVVDVISKKVA